MPTQEVKRKLAAILSADVKGYSRLMGEDEKGTVRILNAYKEVMTGLIQHHHGRVVDAPGDNVLAEFASVVDAVECAVEIQKELKTRNAELSENRRIEFRIGVNLGDVIEDGEQILGDGVNIAARLESLSQAGGICPITKIGNTLTEVTEAAKIKAQHSISYADCFVVATAIREKASIITGDPDFKHVEKIVAIDWL
jgi:class 3 adenylate cyclase